MELAYIAAANWKRFLQPWIDVLKEDSMKGETDSRSFTCPRITIPNETTRLRLLSSFHSSLTSSLNILHTRTSTESNWATLPNDFANPLLIHTLAIGFSTSAQSLDVNSTQSWVLISAFCACYNPPRTDMRLFYRSAHTDEWKRKKGGGTKKTRIGRKSKVPQKLLGPLTFSRERLLAILGALYAENNIPGIPDQEVRRASVMSNLSELLMMGVLEKAPDKAGLAQYKCLLNPEQANSVSKKLGFDLPSFLWDPWI